MDDLSFKKILVRVREFESRVSEEEEREIAEFPEYSYKYAESLLDVGLTVPDFIVESISLDSDLSCEYAKILLRTGQEIPENIIDSIFSDYGVSHEFVVFVSGERREVFDRVVSIVSRCPDNSVSFALILIETDEDVPEVILRSIASDRGSSLWFAVELSLERHEEVPEVILESIGKSSWHSLAYVEEYVDRGYDLEEIPEYILFSASRDERFLKKIEEWEEDGEECVGYLVSLLYDKFLEDEKVFMIAMEFLDEERFLRLRKNFDRVRGWLKKHFDKEFSKDVLEI